MISTSQNIVTQNAARGIPVQRPLFIHHENDPRCYTEQFEYLLGPDVLVAPVWQNAKQEHTVYLPAGEWVHLWTGRVYDRGEHSVPAPMGCPPVFWRRDSRWAALFDGIRRDYGLRAE